MMNTGLPQGKNNLEIVGDLKTNGLISEFNDSGKEVIRGNVVIESKIGDKINELRVNVYSTEGTKPFNNLKKALDFPDKSTALSPDMIPKVRVIGSLKLNEYVNTKDNTLLSFNRNSAAFIYKSTNSADTAMADIGCVITDKRRDEEGNLYLDILNVGYRETIIEIKGGIRVPKEFEEQVDELYEIGDTAVIGVELINSVKVIENDKTVAFGQVLDDTEKEYFSEYVLTGGYPPLESGKGYTEEQIERIKSLRKQQYEQVESRLLPETSGGMSGFNNFAASDDSNPFA